VSSFFVWCPATGPGFCQLLQCALCTHLRQLKLISSQTPLSGGVGGKARKDNLGAKHCFSPDGFILIPMGPIPGRPMGGLALAIFRKTVFKLLKKFSIKNVAMQIIYFELKTLALYKK